MRLFVACLFTATLCPRLLAIPLSFEQRSPMLFQARMGNESVAIQPDSITLDGYVVRFARASHKAHLEGLGAASPATYVSSNARRTFAQFPRVAVRKLYPGIDAIFYGNGKHLEYDLVIAPGADPRRVRLVFEGSGRVEVDGAGDLRFGNLVQKLPRVFQADGRRIAASYFVAGKNQVGLRVGAHDAKLGITIDPELTLTKYFGGSGSDSANAIATDAQGNTYIAGLSNSVDFPTTSGVVPRLSSALAAIAGGTTKVTALPVSSETSVLGIGGTPDGRLLYAVAADATYVSSDHGATWLPRGALPIPTPAGGQTAINSISVDSIDPSRAFVATIRGLYSTSDGGQHWSPRGTGLPLGAVGSVEAMSVAVSPLDHLVVYVATISPEGLYKSVDGGNTFSSLNPTYPGQPQVPPYQVDAFSLGPNGSDLYFVDPFAVLLKSTDGGTTWQKLGLPGYLSSTVIVDPANPSNVYVLTYSGIQKSVDGGMTFGSLYTIPPGSGSGFQMALDSASGTLYFAGTILPLSAISTAGGPVIQVQVSTPNLHALAAIGGQVYAGFDTPSMPYVIKVDPTGANILYSTFFGGTRQDYVAGLAVDAQGNCTVVGTTYSPDFPVTTQLSPATPGASLPSGYAAKLSADGTRLVYSMLLGGAAVSRSTSISAVALDGSGAAYVTGQTAAPDYPISANAFQAARPQATCNRPGGSPFFFNIDSGNAFVTKIGADGAQLVYSTLVTGSCGSLGLGIAVNAAGEAVVSGATNSSDFPATAGAYQAAFPGQANQTLPPNALSAGFATKLSAGGDRVLASTYIGGSYATQVAAVALDAAGNAYLTGSTAKILPGATAGAYQTSAVDRCVVPGPTAPSPPYSGTNDAYVLKLDPTLSTAAYLTYLGGGCDELVNGIALDAGGNAWITGYTASADFPLKSAFQGNGSNNRFVSEISADGSQLLFSSITDGTALAIAPGGAVYLAGSGAGTGLAKRVQSYGGYGAAVEWSKIDPGATPTVVIDNIQPVTGYPQSPLVPSNFGNGIAPGELVQITGHNLGPATAVNGAFDAVGRMPFALSGVTVLFDNVPAPLVSVSETKVVCLAPFEIARSTSVTVSVNGEQSNSVRLGVTASNIQILAVSNADGTVNSAAHPAKAGDAVVLYMSGVGETTPFSADGLRNTAPLPVPAAPVLVGGAVASPTPEFVGAAPGQVAGIVQVNVRLSGTVSSSGVTSVRLNGASATVYVMQ